MKKLIALVVIAILLMPAVAFPDTTPTGGTATSVTIGMAESRAKEIDTLITALWGHWMDRLNAYNLDPADTDPPSWPSSLSEMVPDNLPASFPVSLYALTPAGNNVEITTTVDAALTPYIGVYLPAAEITGNTVKVTVLRPRAFLGSSMFVKRDGTVEGGGPTFLPGSTVAFGEDVIVEFASGSAINIAGSSLDFSDGSLSGIEGLIYRGEELDERFVNIAGDTMTGQLVLGGSVIYMGQELDDRYLRIHDGGTIYGDITFAGDVIYRDRELDDRYVNRYGDTIPGDLHMEGDLYYRGQEIDSRYVKRSGDTIDGDLNVTGDLTVDGVRARGFSDGLDFNGNLYVNGKKVARMIDIEDMKAQMESEMSSMAGVDYLVGRTPFNMRTYGTNQFKDLYAIPADQLKNFFADHGVTFEWANTGMRTLSGIRYITIPAGKRMYIAGYTYVGDSSTRTDDGVRIFKEMDFPLYGDKANVTLRQQVFRSWGSDTDYESYAYNPNSSKHHDMPANSTSVVFVAIYDQGSVSGGGGGGGSWPWPFDFP